MATVKNLMERLDTLRQREFVWSALREYLEDFLPEGGGRVFPYFRGVPISQDTIISVLAELDSKTIEPLRADIADIEMLEVSGEQEKPSTAQTGGTRKRNGGAKKGSGDGS